MPFRVRKSVRIAPGIRLNASNRGLSLSAGGGGVYYTTRGRSRGKPGPVSNFIWGVIALAIILTIVWLVL